MKTIRIIILSLCALCQAQASQATFSADGKTIYLLPMSAGDKVHVIDVTTQKHQTIQPVKNLADDYYSGMARNPKGEILLATSKSLWSWNGQLGTAQKILNLPKNFIVNDISCILSKGITPTGTIFLHGIKKDEDRNSLYALLPGKQKVLEVFCRRNETNSAPQTNAAGRMFVASNYDLWECTLIQEPVEAANDELAGSMEGSRIAPLAMMNTDSGNSGGMTVGDVVVAGEQIFSLLQGRHMGTILQTTAPKNPLYANAESNGHPDLVAQYQLMQQSLAATKILFEGGPCDALCVLEISPTEYHVFWRQDLENERAWILLKSGGKPQSIGTEDPE
jgi:hypothetical protein